ncbi:unnamed protein product, partial [marine sediment metagenome]
RLSDSHDALQHGTPRLDTAPLGQLRAILKGVHAYFPSNPVR